MNFENSTRPITRITYPPGDETNLNLRDNVKCETEINGLQKSTSNNIRSTCFITTPISDEEKQNISKHMINTFNTTLNIEKVAPFKQKYSNTYTSEVFKPVEAIITKKEKISKKFTSTIFDKDEEETDEDDDDEKEIGKTNISDIPMFQTLATQEMTTAQQHVDSDQLSYLFSSSQYPEETYPKAPRRKGSMKFQPSSIKDLLCSKEPLELTEQTCKHYSGISTYTSGVFSDESLPRSCRRRDEAAYESTICGSRCEFDDDQEYDEEAVAEDRKICKYRVSHR